MRSKDMYSPDCNVVTALAALGSAALVASIEASPAAASPARATPYAGNAWAGVRVNSSGKSLTISTRLSGARQGSPTRAPECTTSPSLRFRSRTAIQYWSRQPIRHRRTVRQQTPTTPGRPEALWSWSKLRTARMPSPTGASTCWSLGCGSCQSVGVSDRAGHGAAMRPRLLCGGNPPVRGRSGPLRKVQPRLDTLRPGRMARSLISPPFSSRAARCIIRPQPKPEWSRQFSLGGGNGTAGWPGITR